MRERISFSVLLLLLVGLAANPQSRYFPPGSLGADNSRSEWYSTQLKALDEPSLWLSSKTPGEQSYRFLWLRTFHHPIVIRVQLNADGTSRLTRKVTSGAGGYEPGHLIERNISTLSKEQSESFLRKIDEYKFWELESDNQSGGNDGAQWIIEGVKNGTYHIVDRWSPKEGAVRAIGLLMLHDLAGMQINAKETY